MAQRESHQREIDTRERDLFLEALELPTAEERAAFLDKTCGENRALRATVLALLESHREDAFLEMPALGVPLVEGFQELSGAVLPGESPGDFIGPYQILQKIGEGGCGTVYLAEQTQPVRRKVALKVIKFGMDTKQVIARFEAERQALALMNHPNIARVLDGGATRSGRPFFVMELVEGVRITTYSDQNRLSTPERLELFTQVCHAIQHAHQKGIIHRDIKPSNILVTLLDGKAVPKVIDFGVAKAIRQPLTDKTVFTHFHTFIGTPAYTSPEQAEMSGLDVDTRSDIYSLGVLLYELLTGRTPFDPDTLREANLDEIRRIIRDVEPRRPSTRINGLTMSDATALSGAHREKVPVLVRSFRGDLDWIVMKCLEKDRSRRYETANALALDIRRYLDNEPVLARRPSATYRIQKFVRRNRVMVGFSVAIALVLTAGLFVSSWLAVRATIAEREQSRLNRAVQVALKQEARLREQAQIEQLAALRRAYNSDMNLVQQALAANNYGRVLDLLGRHVPAASPSTRFPKPAGSRDFRQWEWRYFWGQSRSEAAFVLPRQAASINSLVLSPNGRFLVSGTFNGALKLWDVHARRELAVISDRIPGSAEVAFSHDSSQLAIVTGQRPNEAIVRLWAVNKGGFTSEIRHPAGVQAVAFSPDDSNLFTFAQSRIRMWDLQTRELQSERPVRSPTRWGYRRAEFAPDLRCLAALERDRIHVFSVETGLEQALTGPLEDEIGALAFSPDGALLAAGPLFSGTNTAIRLFETKTGVESGRLVGHVSWVPDLRFTGDGQRLISAGADQTLRVWDVPNRHELATLRGHLSEIYSVAVSADGTMALTGCKDGSLFGWDCQHLQTRSPFEVLPRHVSTIEFLPHSRQMISINQDQSLSVWNTATLHELEQLPLPRNRPERVVISPDGARVYFGGRDGRIAVFDWASRTVLTNLTLKVEPNFWPGPGADDHLIALVDRGRTLVVQSSDRTISLLDTSTWQPRHSWRMTNELNSGFGSRSPRVTPDERTIVFVGTDGTAEFHDLQTGAIERTISVQRGRVSAMAFSPDSRLFASSSIDGTVNLWDCVQHQMVDVLRGHLLGIESVSFSPDGQRLASTSHGSEAVKIWDVATRHEVATLAGEGSLFRQVQFSPDGKLLMAINVQGQAHFWRAPSLEECRAE